MKTSIVQKTRGRNNIQQPFFPHLFLWVCSNKTIQKAVSKCLRANLTPARCLLLMPRSCCSHPFISSHIWTSFIHSLGRRCCGSLPPRPLSFPESTPVLRAAKQPPSSPPQCPPAVVLRRGAWGGSGSDMYFTDVLKHMVWMPWMPWKITVTCPNPLPICWHSITFHKLLDTIFPSASL